MAGLAVAALHGFEIKDALKIAEKTYVDVNIFKEEHKDRLRGLSQLPSSCWESALALENQKAHYLKHGIFSEGMIDWIIRYLKAFDDQHLRQNIGNNEEEIVKLVQQYFNCG
jgi:glutamine synthetase